MNIDEMEAGPELDALLAGLTGLNVLGFINVEREPECCCEQHWTIPFDRYARVEHYDVDVRPVYLKECCCDLIDESDPDYVDYFGHTLHCLGVVLPYSTVDAATWKLVAELDSIGFIICLLDRLGYDCDDERLVSLWRCEFMDEGAHAEDRPRGEIWKGIARAATARLAICCAAMKI